MTSFHNHHIRNWWIRTVATEVRDRAYWYVKGENLAYFKAALKLIADDPDGFAAHGCDMGDIRFCDHVRRGKKLVSVRAVWGEKWKKPGKDLNGTEDDGRQ